MDKTIFELVAPIILGGILGFCATYFKNRSLARRFSDAVTDLERHIEASKNSIDTLRVEHPRYFLAARIRYCRFLEDVADIESGWWVRPAVRRSHRMFLLSIRNSDIFIDEVASRVDRMDERELAESFIEVKKNLDFLDRAVHKFNEL